MFSDRGAGGYGKVFQVRPKGTSDCNSPKMAAKKIRLDVQTMKGIVETLAEFKIIKKLTALRNRPGGDKVIAYRGNWLEMNSSDDNDTKDSGSSSLQLYFYLLMDECYMDLFSWLTTKTEPGPIPYKKLLDIIQQMVCGLSFIHGAGIIHLDINVCNDQYVQL